jgi:transcriptional regulator with GAF, ATPase, and Fis domain
VYDESKTIRGVEILWDTGRGKMKSVGRDLVALWLDPSLLHILVLLREEIGTELFQLLVAHSSSQGAKEDYETMVSVYADNFEDGFLAWGRAVGVVGWGRFELPEMDTARGTARVIVRSPWELVMQQHLDEPWGCPFMRGKLIGIFRYALGANCWADERCFVENDEPVLELTLYPSTMTIEAELDRLRRRLADKRATELQAQVDLRTEQLRRSEEHLRATLSSLAALKARIEGERDYLREEVKGAQAPLVAESEAMKHVLEAVRAVAATDATVLIEGETGAGKEVVAREIHAASQRADGPLVKVNCASIPRELFESEFFGHVRGAFTGATRDRRGRFELADGGTVFLDEVGEIPLELQAKLLRVLQEHELERVGDDRTRRVDVRVIAATNRDLAQEVADGRFRADLYYRLSVFPIVVPPLRERVEDIAPLARSFLARYAAATRRHDLELSAADLRRLEAYDWPGNIRELSHVIERAVILSPKPPLRLDLAAPGQTRLPGDEAGADEPRVRPVSELRELERRNILLALEEAGKIAGRGGAADLLQMSPSTLRDRMRALDIVWRRGRRR